MEEKAFNEEERKYWEDRQLETFNDGEKNAFELAKKLKPQYEKAIREIETKINAFYGKYQTETGFDMQEVKKLLNKSELKSFNAQLDEYIKYLEENDGSQYFLNKAKLLKYKTNISRLQELETNLEYEVAKLEKNVWDEVSDGMYDLYEDAYYENIYNLDKFNKMATSFTKPNTKAIENYIRNGFNIGNYSVSGDNRVWDNLNKLTSILNTKIPQGLILGYNPKKVAKIANDTLNTDYNATVRLVRTEYNYILNQATKDSYEVCGIDRYQILVALDERTCDTCGGLDLLVCDYNETEVGLNYPPFHPNCRCTTIPYFEPDEFDVDSDRIAKDKDGKPYMVPADLTFKEWKAGLSEHEGGIMYFNDVIKNK